MGKVIHRELYKKFEFNLKNKWYIQNTESVPESETHKIFWNFEIQGNNLILARRPDLVIVNNKKRTCRTVNFAIPADHWVKVKLVPRPKSRTEKLWNMKMTVIPFVTGALGTIPKELIKEFEDRKKEEKWRPSRLQHS